MGRLVLQAMTVKYPKISIVTPSFNQAEFLERTIRSVLDQQYPNLEYIIIDGGSTDGSVEIIRKYESHLAYWTSEPDEGQVHAINKGLRLATGEWVAWQNSDDIYYPGALDDLAEAIDKNPEAELLIGKIMLIDEKDELLRDLLYVKPTYGSLLAEGMVLANQASFWRGSLHAQVGLLDESLHYAFDYEWFLRLLEYTDRSVHIPSMMGALRYHDSSKTSLHQPRFDKEFSSILEGREMPRWQKQLYRARRMLLMLADGHWRYVSRGLLRRISG